LQSLSPFLFEVNGGSEKNATLHTRCAAYQPRKASYTSRCLGYLLIRRRFLCTFLIVVLTDTRTKVKSARKKP
jgi:hypothetical protein